MAKKNAEKTPTKQAASSDVASGPGYDDDGNYDPERDYGAKSDADALTRAEEIRQDPDRHQKAMHHLNKRAEAAKNAQKASRKHLEKHVKKGLHKAFGGEGGGFQAEKEREEAGAEKIVNTEE